MTIEDVKQKAEHIWENNNPNEISSFNEQKNSFVEGVVEGFIMGKQDHTFSLLSKFLSNDESEYSSILSNLKQALKNEPDSFVDNVKNLQVISNIEFCFNVKEFCELIDLNLQNDFYLVHKF